MRPALKIGLTIFIVAILTIVTQVGGLIFLLSFFIFRKVERLFPLSGYKTLIKTFGFIFFYLICTFLIVSLIAPLFGRVALPVFEIRHLKPLTIGTCLLNRHYVKAELRETAFKVSERLHKAYPGTSVSYMDANFPFFDGFPLVPHLSHHDGKKLDVAFLYKRNGIPSNANPSPIGYGASEGPKSNEKDMPEVCDQQGYWQYSFMSKYMPLKKGFEFDDTRTKKLISEFLQSENIAKMFIEPHLKQRLRLTSSKIRFHGCQSVRHDDHIHVQLR